ncbi:hypothetical protein EJ357_03945 [Streptomyces cyaneochromogenes]|uniref:Uncharacterized protein n=2 Tax=Streptomyces cyaneochromogenes TaxID=2496836 RepID=A0A3S9MM33_9ACTN|nr:hypothetical protein EJ357_03945 [Streptomyces cyaneochromogenes]
MVTARTAWRMVRTPSDVGPLPRVLALAVLLFGVLVTHAVHVESVSGHLVTSAAAPAAFSDDDVRGVAAEFGPLSAAAADDHQGGHEASHPGEQCASGQPQQGSGVVPPCFAASVRESTGSDDAAAVRVSAADGPMDRASSGALRAASVVQQV